MTAKTEKAAGEEWVKVDCLQCGVSFGLTPAFVEGRRENHQPFACPNGHAQNWGQTSPSEKWMGLYEKEREVSAGLRIELLKFKAKPKKKKRRKR